VRENLLIPQIELIKLRVNGVFVRGRGGPRSTTSALFWEGQYEPHSRPFAIRSILPQPLCLELKKIATDPEAAFQIRGGFSWRLKPLILG